MAQEFIDGLSDHCDRWCERCPLTSRCKLFSHFGAPAPHDALNAAFWTRLQATRGKGLEWLAARADVRLPEVVHGPVPQGPEGAREAGPVLPGPTAIGREAAAIDDHPLVDEAQAYAERVEAWIDERRGPVEEAAARDALAARDLADAIDVVRWYQHQLVVKLFVALSDDADAPSGGREEPTSAVNGTVKVALQGIDRSIAAWTRVHDLVPAVGGIFDLLLRLDRLRRRAEAEFPLARAFKRPGFDAA